MEYVVVDYSDVDYQESISFLNLKGGGHGKIYSEFIV